MRPPHPALAANDNAVTLTVDDIRRVLLVLNCEDVPARTVRWRVARHPARVRVPRPGRVGGYQLAVPLDAYCASRNLDPADVLAALGDREAA